MFLILPVKKILTLMKQNKAKGIKIITQRKDLHRFKIIGKKKIAGLKISGSEIKSIRNHQIFINDAYIMFQKNELYLYKASISAYRCTNLFSGQGQKTQKLLLKKSEINQLITQIKIKHYNLIPLKVFISEKGWAKLEIALVQTLKKFQIKALAKEKSIKKKLQRREYEE
jgi:SsrA-binding protein